VRSRTDRDQAKAKPAESGESVILPELQFRKKPPGSVLNKHDVTVSRWISPQVPHPLELAADPNSLDDSHVLTYALKPTEAELTFQGKEFLNGQVGSQHLLLTGPYQPIRSIQRQPFDGIRIYLPQSLFAECYASIHRRASEQQIVVSDPKIMMDPLLEAMMQLIFRANQQGGAFIPSFVEGMSLAIVSRLLHLDMNGGLQEKRVGGLARWRLRRAVEYIDAHVGRPIYLSELGDVTGLSKMRFAAQFRIATGYSPHEFILRRKIMKAQELLGGSDVKLADLALSLGFHSQAHFTTVFKKIAGASPGEWRRLFRDS